MCINPYESMATVGECTYIILQIVRTHTLTCPNKVRLDPQSLVFPNEQYETVIISNPEIYKFKGYGKNQ